MSEKPTCGKLFYTGRREWDSGDVWREQMKCKLPRCHDGPCGLDEERRGRFKLDEASREGYQWDFDKINRLSFRRGNRLFIIYKDGREVLVAPEDRDRLVMQWEQHCRVAFQRMLRRHHE